MRSHATLTRRVTFSAAHRYRRPEWDDARNAEVFGACAWPNWHGHTYLCDVTVGGAIDPLTGFCADLGRLDTVLRERVTEKLDHRNLVLDVADFAEGQLIPTTENIAAWILREVQAGLAAVQAGLAAVQAGLAAVQADPRGAEGARPADRRAGDPPATRVLRVRVAEEPGLWAEVSAEPELP